jgi:hypothetical protein
MTRFKASLSSQVPNYGKYFVPYDFEPDYFPSSHFNKVDQKITLARLFWSTMA